MVDARKICEGWIADGRGDDCFWEGFPDCPTEDLTPRQLLEEFEKLHEEVVHLRAVQFAPSGDNHHNAALCPHCGEPLRKALAEIDRLQAQLAAAPRVIGRRVLRGDETFLDLSEEDISDLSPLAGMPLEVLNLNSTQVSDLTPLQGMPLEVLYLGNTQVNDLSPLKGMPLKALYPNSTPVCDLTPLSGMPLERLYLGNTQVNDLSPLKGMPLKWLGLDRTPAAKQPRPEWLPSGCTVYGLEG